MAANPPDKKRGRDFVVCSNGRTVARYHVDEKLEAGMVLTGSEVKSLRGKRGDLDGSYARIEKGELVLHKMYIGPYAQASAFGHELRRPRKLLVHKHELEKLTGKLAVRGYTLVPIQVYFKNGRAKIELGLAKSKDMEDKREDIKRKLDVREAKAAMARGRERR
jgi:SsrA-binding protein